jgi:heme/copper-type cytochrome/quinol oxidase subunit 2
LKTKKEKGLIERDSNVNYGKLLYIVFLCVILATALCLPAFAATPTIWEKATEIMKDVYNQILLISTIAAVVCAAVALLLMNFSKSGKTVDESRAWLKRIAITWAILNSLGFIMAYVTPFFSGGKWNG